MKWPKFIFFAFFIRPIVLFFLGVHIRNREALPENGPAIIISNHNSHLDALVLMSIFPMNILRFLRPVGAADYFLRTRLLSWFSQNMMDIIPIQRKITRTTRAEDLFHPIQEALDQKSIVIYFPEGTRGEPEQMQKFKSGIGLLAERNPKTPIIPIFMRGLGKALPRGEGILVPFVCDIVAGDPVYFKNDPKTFASFLEAEVIKLSSQLSLTKGHDANAKNDHGGSSPLKT